VLFWIFIFFKYNSSQ